MQRRHLAYLAGLTRFFASVTVALAGPLDAYLPKSGVIEGHIMTLGVAPEDQAIDRQFRNAVANNMDWFKKAVTGGKAGAPLPYNPRMGITQAQYQQLQHMTADFHPGAAISIKVARGADGAVSFSSQDPAAAGLDKVTFPADEKVADTPFGNSTSSTRCTRTMPAHRSASGPGRSGRMSRPRKTPPPTMRTSHPRRSPSASASRPARA